MYNQINTKKVAAHWHIFAVLYWHCGGLKMQIGTIPVQNQRTERYTIE